MSDAEIEAVVRYHRAVCNIFCPVCREREDTPYRITDEDTELVLWKHLYDDGGFSYCHAEKIWELLYHWKETQGEV